MTPQVERDAHLTQTYWMEIRHIVKKIYREKLALTSEEIELQFSKISDLPNFH